MKRIRFFGSRRDIRKDIDEGAYPADKITASGMLAPPIPTQSGSLEPNVELFRGRIQPGNGERRVSAYLFESTNELIEIHRAQSCGALTFSEGKALRGWLHQNVLDRLPVKPVGWLRRLLWARR